MKITESHIIIDGVKIPKRKTRHELEQERLTPFQKKAGKVKRFFISIGAGFLALLDSCSGIIN
jgi:hypothetical protein